MSALLRRSTGIARVAGYSLSQTGLRSTRVLRNTSPRAALAASAASSARHQQSLRFYSNKGDGKDKSDKIEKSEKGPASDTEAKAEGAASPKDEEKPLPEGWVHLSEDDLKVFESFKNSNMLPWVSNKDKALLDGIKKTGVPVDLRDIMHRWRSGSPSLADTGKLLKGINTLAKRMAEEEVMQNINPDRQSEAYRNAGTKKATEKKTEQDMETETERGTEKASSQKQGEEAEKSKTEEEPKIDFRPNDPSKDGNNESQGSQGNRKRPPPSEFKSPDMVTTIVGCAVAWWLYSSMFDESGREITWQDLRKNFLDKGLVEKLAVTGRKVRVYLNKEATQSMYPDSVAVRPGFHYYFSIGSVDSFERHLDDAQEELGIPAGERIPVSYVGDSMLFGLVATLGPTLLFFGLLMWMQRRGPGGGGSSGIFGMGKSRAKRFNHEASVKTKFSDVAGMDEAKQEILEFVSFLQKPEKFKKLGAKIPRGAILAGPPGTGKTMIAKATAGESGVPFFSVSGSEFVEMFVGVGASRVRDLFAEARKSAPCIVFIDEIDAIGKARSEGKGFSGGHDEREATLNQILTEMDGFNTTEQVVVLAGTNRVDILDKALMRPGRFDRHINIDMPTMAGRQDIFKVYLPKIKTHEEIEYLSGRLATLTPGFAGADIANCVNEAALIAARHDASAVTLKHFELAIERVIGGLERKSLVLNPQERKVVAYHEAGHAICGWYFQFADPLLKVSIIPRGKGLGYAQYLPADAYLMNSSQLMDRMAMTLGGRISEELHFETVTTGGSDDFDKVTRMATSMVTQWGMSDKLGTINYSKDNNEFNKPYAETTGQVIDAEIKRIVAEAYKQCKDLLVEKKKEVGIVAEELLSKEVLVRDDMIRLLGPRPFDDRDASFNKYFGGKQPVDVDGGGAPDVDQPPPGGDTPAPNPAMFKAIQDKDTTR